MRLTSIKLSGFKSFVDPTTLLLPSNFTVVVGPNGCGKSNIIDAVRWVMGESSAGRLRGEALSDVIFSGSASRKPVSQASVELVFDNSDRLISGQYAGFDEISVKRRVARDGSSDYFLNGSRCRKRDITDLFLGTGLGPRSYAIIEQGMISQVIDAKPEALRAYLEEAAGISLYKERRRETQGRISQTRENLERLADLRGEIGRQLEHLRVQAEQASQYQQWQGQRQQLQGQVLALQYRQAEQQRQQLADQLLRRQAEVDAAVLQIQALDAAQSGPLQQLQAAQQALEQAQAAVYAQQAEHTRLQQMLVHAQSLLQRQQVEQAQADTGLGQLQGQLERDRSDNEQQQAQLAALAPQLQQAARQLEQAQQALAQAQARRSAWQQQWEQATRQRHDASTAVTRERTRQEFMARQHQQLLQRIAEQDEQLQALQAGEDPQGLAQAEQTLHDCAQQLEQAQAQAALGSTQRLEAEAAQQRADQALQAARGQQQLLAAQQVALQTLQAAALGADDAAQRDWLQVQGLADVPRLASVLKVQAGYQDAVEAVLGPWLQALVVPARQRRQLQAQWNGQGVCRLVDDLPDDHAPALPVAADSLASKVQGPPLARWLLGAVGLPGAAAPGDGWQLDEAGWLHGAFASVGGCPPCDSGVLAREQQLALLQSRLEHAAAALQAAEGDDAQARAAVDGARRNEQQALAGLDQARQQQAGAHARVTVLRAQREDQQRALARALAQQQALTEQQRQLAAELQAIETTLAQAQQALAQAQQASDALASQRQALEDDCELAQAQLADSRERQQALVLARETGQARQAALGQALQRGLAQQQALQQRLLQLDAAHTRQAEDQHRLQQAVAAAQQQLADAGQALVQAQQHQQQAKQAAEQATEHRQQRQQWLEEQREQLVQLRLQLQAAELNLGHVHTQAEQAQLDLPAAVSALEPSSDVVALNRQLRQIDARLAAMGAVNLAAIEEFEQANQRHAWLEEQQGDLSAALETLEAAMAKIDRETRARFKQTFDKVNAGLQDLYPRLFGGGQAWLELTEGDLLDAGVLLMARPPGKKVSTLSLLSGGEKAMTAVALVFAIFQLNPAPFCLLDEVDAPLDEANVGRLAQMLQQMSQSVQFLSVSHNKATMEAAEQLCGVTMREPGVSRLVSVDLQQAAQLAGAA